MESKSVTLRELKPIIRIILVCHPSLTTDCIQKGHFLSNTGCDVSAFYKSYR